MANTLNVVNETVVTMTTSDTDSFYTASKAAKEAGSKDVCGFSVVTRYEPGNCCRVWVAYSNGVWTNCVDCDCLDTGMKNAFVNYVRNRAAEANLALGYNAE